MIRALRLLPLMCLPLLAAQANATIIVSTSSDRAGCGGPYQPPCPPPPVSTFNGGLIVNGDFGDGNFTGFSGSYTTINNSSQSGTYYYSEGGVQGDENSLGGAQAYLAANGADKTLSQTFSTTPGDTYSVSFQLYNFDQQLGDGPVYDFSTSFGDQLLLSFANPTLPAGAQQMYNLQAVATGTSTTLLFSARNDDGAFLLTDIAVFDTTPVGKVNLAVAQTPEPDSLVLLATGALGLIGAARRRLRATRLSSACG